MMYVRQPTDEEQHELKRMSRREVGRVSERAHMILLSAQHRTVPEISTIFGVSRARVRLWIRRFDLQGPEGLRDEVRSGRPRKVTAQVHTTLTTLMQSDPLHSGFLATFWTTAMLTAALFSLLGVHLSMGTVHAALRELDLRWGRPRLTMPRKTDPDKALKQWRIAEAILQAGPHAHILYADESRVQLLPLVRAMWHWIGQQVRVPTPGTNSSRALFGALNIRSGRWSYLVRKRMLTADFLAFLQYLLVSYPVGAVVLVVDNYSSHTAKAVREWLTQPDHTRLRLMYLPTYCSHLNPVERIWLRLKDKVAANRLHGSMAALLESVDTFFKEMTPQQALVWAGIQGQAA
jgi:transposase